MQRNFLEKRRKNPSYIIPFFYLFLELLLMYLFLAFVNWHMDIYEWSFYAYIAFAAWSIYAVLKLYFVLQRQKEHYE